MGINSSFFEHAFDEGTSGSDESLEIVPVEEQEEGINRRLDQEEEKKEEPEDAEISGDRSWLEQWLSTEHWAVPERWMTPDGWTSEELATLRGEDGDFPWSPARIARKEESVQLKEKAEALVQSVAAEGSVEEREPGISAEGAEEEDESWGGKSSPFPMEWGTGSGNSDWYQKKVGGRRMARLPEPGPDARQTLRAWWGRTRLKNIRQRQILIVAGFCVCGVMVFFVGNAIRRIKDLPSAVTVEGSMESSTGQEQNVESSGYPQSIPVGFDHTSEGAVEAATFYLAAFTTPLLRNSHAHIEFCNAIVVPGQRKDFVAQAAVARETLVKYVNELSDSASEERVLLHAYPLRHTVEGGDGKAAIVSIWAVSLFGVENAVPLRSGFVDYQFELEWLEDDWKIRDARVMETPTGESLLPFQVDTYIAYDYQPGQG